MAQKKKVFIIEINGITESVRSIDALTEKIKLLENSKSFYYINGVYDHIYPL